MRTAVWITIPVLIVPLFVWTQSAKAAEPCSRVVSYFLYSYQGSKNQNEWRIFDPSRGTDTLFISLPGGFQQVRWDTTFQNVYFSSGDSIYTAQWRMGAKPRFVIRLPAGDGPWWLNSDKNGTWQFLRLREQTNTEGKDNLELSRKSGELLESNGGEWRLIRADSVFYFDDPRDHGEWVDGSPVPRGTPVVALDDLASEAWGETWEERSVTFDTTSITITQGDETDYDQWFFLGLKSDPRRGFAFQRSGSGAPEYDWIGIQGSLYFVDLDKRTKRRLDEDESSRRSLVAEHCGFVLIPGVEERPLVIDSSGNRVFSPPENSNGAVWVPRPRE